MLENFGNLFNRQPQSQSGQNLFGDDRLEESLGGLTDAAYDERYPLQVAFYEKLLQCELLLPVPSGTNLKKGLPILALENNQGEKGMPLFTSEKTLNLWVDESKDYVTMPFGTLCAYALEAKLDYVVINVAGPYGCEISFHDFSYLAEGLLPPPRDEFGRDPGEILIGKNTPVRLATSRGLSNMLMDRLYSLFAHHATQIEKVYLFDVAFNEGPMQPALGIRMADGHEEEWEMALWPDMQAVLHEMLERREVVNVFLLNQSGGMENHVQELTIPIYESHLG